MALPTLSEVWRLNKDELIAICRSVGISAENGRFEIRDRLRDYIKKHKTRTKPISIVKRIKPITVAKKEGEDAEIGEAPEVGQEAGEGDFGYPPLEELGKFTQKEVSEPGGKDIGKVGAAPPGTVAALDKEGKVIHVIPISLELSPLWKLMGRWIDKDDPVTNEECKALNDAVKAMGVCTMPPEHPILVPNWFPLIIMLVTVFVARLIKAKGPEILEKLKERFAGGKKIEKAKEPEEV